MKNEPTAEETQAAWDEFSASLDEYIAAWSADFEAHIRSLPDDKGNPDAGIHGKRVRDTR